MQQEPIDNGIVYLLQHRRGGECITELSQSLAQLASAVRSSGKKGKLTLELEIAPLSKGGGTAIGVIDRIAVKLPAEEKEVSVFYVGDDGRLSRNDPRQRELPLQAVEGGRQESNQPQTAQASA